MGIFNNLFKKEDKKIYKDSDIVSVATGKLIPVETVNDVMFSQQMMGQTIAFELEHGSIVSPTNGILEVMYPTGHAFAVRMKNGTGILVHIGINTVNLKGKGFKVLAKQGDTVKAGQELVKVNLDEIKNAGYDCTTMLIVTETPVEEFKYNFIENIDVVCGDIIVKE